MERSNLLEMNLVDYPQRRSDSGGVEESVETTLILQAIGILQDLVSFLQGVPALNVRRRVQTLEVVLAKASGLLTGPRGTACLL